MQNTIKKLTFDLLKMNSGLGTVLMYCVFRVLFFANDALRNAVVANICALQLLSNRFHLFPNLF